MHLLFRLFLQGRFSVSTEWPFVPLVHKKVYSYVLTSHIGPLHRAGLDLLFALLYQNGILLFLPTLITGSKIPKIRIPRHGLQRMCLYHDRVSLHLSNAEEAG